MLDRLAVGHRPLAWFAVAPYARRRPPGHFVLTPPVNKRVAGGRRSEAGKTWPLPCRVLLFFTLGRVPGIRDDPPLRVAVPEPGVTVGPGVLAPARQHDLHA